MCDKSCASACETGSLLCALGTSTVDSTWFANIQMESELAAADDFVGFPGDATAVEYDHTEPLDLDAAT